MPCGDWFQFHPTSFFLHNPFRSARTQAVCIRRHTRFAQALLVGTTLLHTSAYCAPALPDLVIGQIAPLTGSNASNGVPVSRGIRLYFEYLNTQGGIHGRRVRLVVRDDSYKVSETVRQARALLANSEILALMTTLGTANNEALVNEGIVSATSIGMLGPRSGASSLYAVPGIYPVRASYHDEARAIARQLSTVGLTRIGAVIQDDSFGNDALAGLEKALSDHGMKLVTSARFERNTTKVEGAVRAMLKYSPQAVVMLAVTDPTAEFVKQFRARGGTSQVICLSIVDPDVVVRHAGIEAARGLAMTVVVPSPSRVTLPVIAEMIQARDKIGWGDLPLTLNAIEGYVLGKVMAEALRRSGPRPTRTSVSRALASLRSIDVGGFTARVHLQAGEERYVNLAVIGAGGVLLQ